MGKHKICTVFATLIMAALVQGVAFGEAPHGVGIVTTLQGQATVAHGVGAQQPIPMKFRDEVYYKDKISVKEHSLARVLLGGKALVTVRELSDLTISELPGKPTVLDMLGGKISLAVAKMRMSPGEAIEVRTPNAIAAVRGTTLVVEIVPTFESLKSGKPADMATNIHVLSGKVDVFSLSSPNVPPVSVGPGFTMTVHGTFMGQLRPNPPMGQMTKGLDHTVHHTETPDGTKNALVSKEMAEAVALSETLVSNALARDQNSSVAPTGTNGTIALSGSTGNLSLTTINASSSLGTSSLGTSTTTLTSPTIIMPPITMLPPPPTMMPPPPPTVLPTLLR
jgi:hypothetical protein